MYCRNCGAEVGSNQKHCRECGAIQFTDAVANEAFPSGSNEFTSITKIFTSICLLLTLVAGLKILADDNYVGLIFVILGFGCLIYGLFCWQNRKLIHYQKSESKTRKQIDSEDGKLLVSGNEQFNVTEETTRKLDPIELRRN